MGFHGELTENQGVEKDLFDFSEHVTEGEHFDNYDNIPVEVSGENIPAPLASFEHPAIPESLQKNIVRCQYKRPTPVQKYGISIALEKRDLMACAQTGSGKTAAYLFPLIAAMINSGPSKTNLPAGKKYYPTAVVLCPTRELASQIHQEAERFCYCTGVAPSCVYGGVSTSISMKSLSNGCDILIGTPGRILDLVERDIIGMEGVLFLVLDEADRMLDMGFGPQIREVVEKHGMPRTRQTMMFSATFPNEIQRLASDFLQDYLFLTVGRIGATVCEIEQRVFYAKDKEKITLLMDELQRWKEGRVLVFCKTKKKADFIHDLLQNSHFKCDVIHGDRNQMDREKALASFRSNEIQVLVATDVAARGLDIPDVAVVINVDATDNIDEYVHRIGRTARAGNSGVAVTFLNERDRFVAKDIFFILKETNQEIPDFLETLCFSNQTSGEREYHRGQKDRTFGGRDIRRDMPRERRDFDDRRRDFDDRRRDFDDRRRDFDDRRRDFGERGRRDFDDRRRSFGERGRDFDDRRRGYDDRRRDYDRR